jgi:AcrR family transcriptional regulator
MAGDGRERLLEAAIDHIAVHGGGGLTLRGLAAGIGTSHRMLIYHFGTREELLIAVLRRMEERQGERLGEAGLDPDGDIAEVIRLMWRQVADPALWPFERLFFEMYGQALQGHPKTVPFLEGVVDTWLDLNVALAVPFGIPAETARAHARLGLAVVRGLLLDLLATGDRAGADAAIELFAARYTDGWAAFRPEPAEAPPMRTG